MATELRRVMLVKTNAEHNNNKYWEGVLFDDGRVEARWGRVGTNGQPYTYSGGEKKLAAKIREKERDNYRQVQVLTDASAITVGQPQLRDVAKSQIRHASTEAEKLIEHLVKVNAHQIVTASGGQLNVDAASGLIKTPVGILQKSAIDQARPLLSRIAKLRTPKKRGAPEFATAVQDYLMLVPQVVPRQRGWLDTLFTDQESIAKQSALLDSLEATIAAIAVAPAMPTAAQKKVFDVELTLLTDAAQLATLEQLYRSTAQSRHAAHGLRIQRVFEVQISSMATAFATHGAKLAPIWQLWHGTRAANVLSILRQGLVVPPRNASHVNGRNYGDGLYFSDQSTKSLNYSYGYWQNTRESTCFMFLCQVGMGKYYIPNSTISRWPTGYDSVFAKAGQSGVLNNEMIVPATSQVNLTHLIEFGA